MSNPVPQPDIAKNLRAISEMLTLVASSERHSAAHSVVAGLKARNTGDTPTETLEEVVAQVLLTNYRINRRASLSLASSVDGSRGVEEAVTALNLDGYPGEELCWSVIGFESQWHINLVWMEANRMAPKFPGRVADDLLGWGWVGLRVALRQFDLSKGFKFSTYACYRIKGSIRDGVRDENPIPKRLLTIQRKIADAEEELSIQMGRSPQLAEIAEQLGETLAPLSKLEAILPRLNQPASIDEMTYVSHHSGSAVGQLINDDDPADDTIDNMRDEAIREAVASLPSEEAEAVRLLVLEDNSMAETRRQTGLSDRELKRRCQRGLEALSVDLADWKASA